jgi:predicted MFS family arabinose efflux permease
MPRSTIPAGSGKAHGRQIWRCIFLAEKREHGNGLKLAILSLSLLTVMAGAAVAPALNVIQEYFSDTNETLVQMIISIPALFIVITNLIFPRLAAKYKARSLLIVGLLLYVVGGSIAGIFNNIYVILAVRSLVGIGVGIIMPLSTGLLSYYYTRDKQDKLMGYSSAMNQLGGAAATLCAGLLAQVSWRLSFLVYMIGIISFVLVLIYLPGDKIGSDTGKKKKESVFRKYYPYIIAMFLLMFTFFIYPSSFAIETAADGEIPQATISVIMAVMDACGFFGGLAYAHIRKHLGSAAKFAAPVILLVGYVLLKFMGGWFGTIAGSVCVGFGCGAGVPFIISSASMKAGRSAGTTVLPLVSAALYTAQFFTPMILSAVKPALQAAGMTHAPYITAIISAVLLILWSFTIREKDQPDRVSQEEISFRSRSKKRA